MEQVAPYTPTQDEKIMAMLAHVLQLVSWLIGPLVIFITKRDSRFVAFHAIQALFAQAFLFVVWLLMLGGLMFTMIMDARTGRLSGATPIAFFVVWGSAAVLWIIVMVLSILNGIRAINGQWSEYPFIGRWARRWYGVAAHPSPGTESNPMPQA